MKPVRRAKRKTETVSELTSAADLLLGIGLVQSLESDELVRLAQTEKHRHLVQKNGFMFDQELDAARRIAKDPVAFFTDPLTAICGPNPDKLSRRFRYEGSCELNKNELIETFSAFVHATTSTRRNSDRALLVADELFTNAAKNGWMVGTPLFEGPATRPGKLEFFAHADADRIIIGCKDTFGELEISNVLARIAMCFKNGVVESIKRGVGGAGIGSFLVLESCVSYFAAVETGKQTVVCAILPAGRGLRDTIELPKHLHILKLDKKD